MEKGQLQQFNLLACKSRSKIQSLNYYHKKQLLCIGDKVMALKTQRNNFLKQKSTRAVKLKSKIANIGERRALATSYFIKFGPEPAAWRRKSRALTLQKRPEVRYAGAAQLADDLRAVEAMVADGVTFDPAEAANRGTIPHDR